MAGPTAEGDGIGFGTAFEDFDGDGDLHDGGEEEEEDEDPEAGEPLVLWSRDSDNLDVWDDSELISAYQEAIDSYIAAKWTPESLPLICVLLAFYLNAMVLLVSLFQLPYMYLVITTFTPKPLPCDQQGAAEIRPITNIDDVLPKKAPGKNHSGQQPKRRRTGQTQTDQPVQAQAANSGILSDLSSAPQIQPLPTCNQPSHPIPGGGGSNPGAPMPPLPSGLAQCSPELTNLIVSWFHSGYWTGWFAAGGSAQ
eukprot:gene7327-176_t